MRPLILLMLLLISPVSGASQSTITEAEGESCVGDDKSIRQTEQLALDMAKRMAIEYTSSHISSTTVVENFQLKQDIVEAFNEAEVRLLEVLEEDWSGQGISACFTVRIRAEVIPDQQRLGEAGSFEEQDPRAPLAVRLWVNATDGAYRIGDDMVVYVEGNKPFFGRLVYTMADGTRVQLLPNEHRSDNYFNGGTVYQVPTARDRFELKVSPPVGQEKLDLFASTSPLGNVDAQSTGAGVYVIADKPEAIAMKTRGVSLVARPAHHEKGSATTTAGKSSGVAEFADASVVVTVAP